VTVEDPDVCQHCGSRRIERDPDVLDTWFSSALWPHSTLGWPDQTEDLRYFYPTGVMETGYDIIFFWVARMIMMGLYNMKEIPFRHVYLHGLVRDEYGEKISKSKITTKHHIPSPVEAIESYGADALRYALMTAGTPGNDLRISEQRMEAGRNFANKLWNAARFVIGHLDGEKIGRPSLDSRSSLPLEDRWIMSRLNRVTADVDRAMTGFQLGEAGRQVHDFLWGEYCDWYLEWAKRVRLGKGDRSPLPVLVHVLDAALRLLHPYMPFVTEAAWQSLSPHLAEPDAKALIVARYPVPEKEWLDEKAERDAKFHIDAVERILNVRADHNVEPGRFIEARLQVTDPSIDVRGELITALARVRPLHITVGITESMQVGDSVVVLDGAQVVLPRLFDLEAERQRLAKQIAVAEAEVVRLQGKLTNEEFLAKAPAAVVEREQEKLTAAEARLAGLSERLQELA
jgi:valyl-tRNA synthetase